MVFMWRLLNCLCKLYWHAAMEDDPANQWLRARIIDAVQRELANLGLPPGSPETETQA